LQEASAPEATSAADTTVLFNPYKGLVAVVDATIVGKNPVSINIVYV
jgi:hypothetical protein